eukprot:COSAG05_NODE_1118_length_5822_cov_11.598288_6_plen_147_part_00
MDGWIDPYPHSSELLSHQHLLRLNICNVAADYVHSLTVIGLVMASILGTFIWDRFVIMLFANHIFMAMLRSAAQTTVSDLMPIFASVVRYCLLLRWRGDVLLRSDRLRKRVCVPLQFKVAIGLAVFGSGNPLIWGGTRRLGCLRLS